MKNNVIKLPVDKIKVLNSDNDVMILDLRLLHIGKNRNQCDISEQSVLNSIDTFYNKPIVYQIANNYSTSYLDDFYEHNRSKTDTSMDIAGSIIESGGFRFEEDRGKKYLHMIGVIHKVYQPTVAQIIKNRGGDVKVSIEIKPVQLAKQTDGTLKIDQFKLLGVCLLGKGILEGIEGSRVNVLKYSAKDYNEKYLKFSKDEFAMEVGSKPAIEIDKSKEAVSTKSWGDVDKVALRNNILEAKNYKTLVKSVYLLVEDGWEEAPSKHLKYPVMEIKEGKLVYNRHALSTALAYAEKEGEKSVIGKVKDLYKKLELQEKEGERVDEILKNEAVEDIVEEVIQNSEETEEVIENTEITFEESAETKEAEETEVVKETEDFSNEVVEEVVETEVETVSIEKFSALQAEFDKVSAELLVFKREKEVSEMKSLIEEYSHCYSKEEKQSLFNSVENSDYATLETVVNELVKSFAKNMKDLKEEEVEKQEFSTGLNIVEKIFEEKKFNLEEYVNNFNK